MRITSFAITFIKANVAFLGLLLTGLGLGGALPVVAANLLVAIPILVTLELIIAGCVWKLGSPSPPPAEPPFPFHTLKREYIEIRFATEADFSGTDRIYNAYFDRGLSMNDADFCQLMKRGNIVRVIEEGYADGSEKATRISGYYGLWPLRKSTYEDIVSGKVKEELLLASDIPELDNSDATILYLSEVCIAKDSDAAAILMRDMLRYVAYLLTKHPRITAVGAWPYTKDGRRWVKELRLKPCNRRIFGRRIYQLDRGNALSSPLIPKGSFKERWRAKY